MTAYFNSYTAPLGVQGAFVWTKGYAAADLDGDGSKEIIIAFAGPTSQAPAAGDATPVILSRASNGAWVNQTDKFIPSGFAAVGASNDVLTTDLNGDGRPDLFITDHGREISASASGAFPGGFNALYLSQPNGTLAPVTLPIGQGFWHSATNTADFDRDGDQDIAVITMNAVNGKNVFLLQNNGTGGFSDATPKFPIGSLNVGSVGFIDVSGDGDADVLVLPYSNTHSGDAGNNALLLINDGSGNFGQTQSFQVKFGFPVDIGFPHFVVADFDGNGLQDFIAVGEPQTGFKGAATYFSVMYQQDDGSVRDETVRALGSRQVGFPSEYSSLAGNKLAVGDFNMDGKPDLFWSDATMPGNRIHEAIWLNNGDGAFHRMTGAESPFNDLGLMATERYRVQIGDLDGDNVPDVVLLRGGQPNLIDSVTVLLGNAARFSGNDTITGSSDANTINGGAGTNQIRGAEGNDSIQGGNSFDDINGNQGNDTINGGDGDDWVVGGKDNDLLFGENGADIVYGNMGDDTCSGGDGADWVRGGQGSDSVSGGTGNDWIWGDRGNDTISGGSGADDIHFAIGMGIDRVLDFNVSEGDRLLLDGGPSYTIRLIGSDTVIDLGDGDQITLVGVSLNAGSWLVV